MSLLRTVYSPVGRSILDKNFLLTYFKVLPYAKHCAKHLTQYLLIYFTQKLYEVLLPLMTHGTTEDQKVELICPGEYLRSGISNPGASIPPNVCTTLLVSPQVLGGGGGETGGTPESS